MADQSQTYSGLSVYAYGGLHKALTLPWTVLLVKTNSVMFLLLSKVRCHKRDPVTCKVCFLHMFWKQCMWDQSGHANVGICVRLKSPLQLLTTHLKMNLMWNQAFDKLVAGYFLALVHNRWLSQPFVLYIHCDSTVPYISNSKKILPVNAGQFNKAPNLKELLF